MQIDDGVLVPPLPEDDEDQRHGRNHAQNDDKVRFEPVFALPFVEDNLQGSEAKRDETEPRVVDSRLFQLAALEVRRILDEPRRQQQRNNADGDIDEENPAPGKGVGEDDLLARLQSSAAHTLKNAEEDEHTEIRREPAKKRTDGEQRDAAHV